MGKYLAGLVIIPSVFSPKNIQKMMFQTASLVLFDKIIIYIILSIIN